jgi:hypothetical protein
VNIKAEQEGDNVPASFHARKTQKKAKKAKKHHKLDQQTLL